MTTKRALGKIDPFPFKTPAKEFLAAVGATKEQAKVNPGRFTRTEIEDPDQMVIERMIPLQRGKWRLMPPGVKPDAP
jgi:hypothetical protein